MSSYYGRPVLKEPVWKWFIPAYFFTGGLAGASSLLGAVAGLAGHRALAQRARLIALAAVSLSGGLLVLDLGRPGRFYNMLRVAKVTSPMSVGSWLLAAYTPAVGVAALAGLDIGVPRLGGLGDVAAGVSGLGGFGAVADVAAGLLGAGVATYTAVLIADTAVPAWRGARRELPFLFAASAAASAGAVAAVVTPAAEAGPARRLAVGAAVVELVAERQVSRALGDVAVALHDGVPGRLITTAKECSAAGAGILALFGRHRPAAIAGGLLVATGAALTRFAVVEAGRASVRDPRFVVDPQRQAVGSGS